MTSTLTPPDASGTDRGPRLWTLAADLLPEEIVQSRRDRRVRRTVLATLAVFAVVLISWCVLARYQTSQATAELTQAQRQADVLRARQHGYSEVVSIQAESATINARLAALLANDLQWTTLLSAVQQLAPHGVQLTAITGSLPNGSSAAADSTVIQLPNSTGEKTVGSLAVSGSGTSKALIASYVDALARVAGLGNPVLSGVTLADGALQFSVHLDITQSMLGGRYTTDGGEH